MKQAETEKAPTETRASPGHMPEASARCAVLRSPFSASSQTEWRQWHRGIT